MPEVGVNPDNDWLLDPQRARPRGFCERCGREVYSQLSDLCYLCNDVDIGDYYDDEE